MTTSTSVQESWLTAAENAVATLAARRLIVDTTNWRTVIHDGVTAGGKPQASEAFVQAQIAALTAGVGQLMTLGRRCI